MLQQYLIVVTCYLV